MFVLEMPSPPREPAGVAGVATRRDPAVLALSKIFDPLVFPISAFCPPPELPPKFEAVSHYPPPPSSAASALCVWRLRPRCGVVGRVDSTPMWLILVWLGCCGGVLCRCGVTINLSGLAVAAIAGILLNAILPGNDYEFDAADGSGSRYQQQPAGLISHRRRKNKAEAVLCVQGGFAVFKVHRAKHTVFEDGF